jgi:hypothetical protein
MTENNIYYTRQSAGATPTQQGIRQWWTKVMAPSDSASPRARRFHTPAQYNTYVRHTLRGPFILLYDPFGTFVNLQFHDILAKKHGGPLGEHILSKSILSHLQRKHLPHLFITSGEELRAMLPQARLVISSPWAMKDIAALPLHHRCKVLIVDFWGRGPGHHMPGQDIQLAPSKAVNLVDPASGLPLSNYLVPYPNPFNSWLGFSVEELCPRRDGAHGHKLVTPPKRTRGLIWGKEAHYYTDGPQHWNSSMWSDLHKAVPGLEWWATVDPASFAALPVASFATNMGHLSRPEWARELASTRLILGLGMCCFCVAGLIA